MLKIAVDRLFLYLEVCESVFCQIRPEKAMTCPLSLVKGTGKIPELYLMEGFMDVIAAYRAGIENAVASMGTALSREHVEHLKRLTQKLVLVYDGDKAGQAATLKALDEIGDMPVQIVSMPDNLDPDEYLQKKWSRRLGLSINENSY